MRLLQYDSSRERYVAFNFFDNVPPYAILSHTWGADDDEVKYNELSRRGISNKPGYKKIQFCAQQAREDGIQYFWVDTCCIDQTNHVELSEAITSMFRWYQQARVCYAYLSDVSYVQRTSSTAGEGGSSRNPWEASLRESRWFTRGWTLQELVAPGDVKFFSQEGTFLGTKHDLGDLLHDVTGISVTALRGLPLSHFSVAERMRWTTGRTTKKKEDQAYCLLGMFDVYMPLIYGEGDNAFTRLIDEINKAPKVELNLRTVEGAEFDAYGQTHQGCHPETRVEVLESIRDWAQDAKGEGIFWLNGMAGTGKSTISWTVSRWLKDLGSGGLVILGASFFFKRGEGDRASAKLLFPTIAIQLATNIRNFDVFLAQSIKAEPQICSKSLGEQFEKLIREPLTQSQSNISHLTYVVVIDALDECDNEIDIRTVLQLWQTLSATTSPRLRLFITSRPDLVIRLGFKKMPVSIHHDMVLHEIPKPIVQHDIHAFLADALAHIREDYNLEADEDALADDWPGSSILQKLTDIAVPLFIVAATMYRFIRDSTRPEQGLQTVLRLQKAGYLSDLGQVYQAVLNAMTAAVRDPMHRDKVYSDFRKIVGVIVCLQEPLSRVALADLLDISPSDIRIQLQSLHAVLQVPNNADSLIRPLHLSFPEYLTSPEAQVHPSGIDSQATHSKLWKYCLRLMSREDGLREDVCDLQDPGTLRHNVSQDCINQYVRPAIQYAGQYWIHHVEKSLFQPGDEDEVYMFLEKHFLHWLEVLSLIGRLADSIQLMNRLIDILSPQLMDNKDSSRTIAFLTDAKRFILATRFMVELAPLQLYCSAVLFAPQGSIVRKICGQVPSWVLMVPYTSSTWGSELQKLEGHTRAVWTVAFSPDDSLIASASWDYTVRLWNASTGQETQKFEGHTDEVLSVAFSPDGTVIATASEDAIILIWDLFTGRQMHRLEGHVHGVCDVVFSHNQSFLASASRDNTVRLWNPANAKEIRKMEGHSSHIWRVRFSADDSLLASVSDDGSIRLWESCTGRETHVIPGDYNKGGAIAFSPDGVLLAFVTNDSTIRVLELSTMSELRSIAYVNGGSLITTLAFSHDNSLLASAGNDTRIRLWNSSTGQYIDQPQSHTGAICGMAFAHNSLLLTAGATDSSIWLWDPSIRQTSRESGHTDRVGTVVFSHDGRMVASFSADMILQLMQVSTGRKMWTSEYESRFSCDIVFSHDDSLLASGSMDGLIRLMDVKTGEEIQRILRHTDHNICALAFSHDDSMLASAAEENVRLWDLSTGEEIHRLLADKRGFVQVAFSPVTAMLVVASYNMRRQIWLCDLSTSVEMLLTEHEHLVNYVTALALSPDGSLLAVASTDSYDSDWVRLWDIFAHKMVWSYESDSTINRISFAPDGNKLFTNRGYVGFSRGRPHLQDSSKFVTYPGLFIRREWITYRGRRLLWLPRDYRDVTDVREDMIAFGQGTGLVSVMKFDLAVLDSMMAQLQQRGITGGTIAE